MTLLCLRSRSFHQLHSGESTRNLQYQSNNISVWISAIYIYTSISMAARLETKVPNLYNPTRSNDERPSEQLVLLDWDDTVMPSTYLISNIGFKADRTTRKVTSVWLRAESKHKEMEIRQSLKESGTAVLGLLRNLYYYFKDSTAGRTLLIVTNAEPDWLWNSLIIAGALSPIYREIEKFLRDHKTQIIYARNEKLKHPYWKLISFDKILTRNFEQRRCQNINLITIGDQWSDHRYIEMTPTFGRHRHSVSHHQIKLFPESHARYIAFELNFIADLFISHESSPSNLLKFAAHVQDGIFIEFKGFSKNTKKPLSPDSPENVYGTTSTDYSNSFSRIAQNAAPSRSDLSHCEIQNISK